MKPHNVLGIDIGTTTICAVVIDLSSGKVLESRTIPNGSVIHSLYDYEKTQDPAAIYYKVVRITTELINKFTPYSIGITGQMHGILYVDEMGDAVSPLYTWQDERGNLAIEGLNLTYAEYLTLKSGYPMSTGFGLTTHYYNCCNNLVPENAKYLCTIGDYIAMKLTCSTRPLMSPSNAASLGGYSVERDSFDLEAFALTGIDLRLLPEIKTGYAIAGKTIEKIPVSVSIGDNQASFIGSVQDTNHTVLVNVGTGSQVSIGVKKNVKQVVRTSEAEIRPCIGNYNIYVGSSLCGGSAYALLEKFFREVGTMITGCEPGPLYEYMEKELWKDIQEPLIISTKFRGTRLNPAIRGSIENIGINNFTPRHFIHAMLYGIAEELFASYQKACSIKDEKIVNLVGSGNGLRKNIYMQNIMENLFQMDLKIPLHNEEAAYGAALFSLVGCGYYQNIDEAQKIICYL
jgi:sedoheptulokinase